MEQSIKCFGQKYNQDVDSKIDDIKTSVGLKLNLNEHTTFKPYIEYLADGEKNDYQKKYIMIGTSLGFKF